VMVKRVGFDIISLCKYLLTKEPHQKLLIPNGIALAHWRLNYSYRLFVFFPLDIFDFFFIFVLFPKSSFI
jgi:hypothetical protein